MTEKDFVNKEFDFAEESADALFKLFLLSKAMDRNDRKKAAKKLMERADALEFLNDYSYFEETDIDSERLKGILKAWTKQGSKESNRKDAQLKKLKRTALIAALLAENKEMNQEDELQFLRPLFEEKAPSKRSKCSRSKAPAEKKSGVSAKKMDDEEFDLEQASKYLSRFLKKNGLDWIGDLDTPGKDAKTTVKVRKTTK